MNYPDHIEQQQQDREALRQDDLREKRDRFEPIVLSTELKPEQFNITFTKLTCTCGEEDMDLYHSNLDGKYQVVCPACGLASERKDTKDLASDSFIEKPIPHCYFTKND